MENKDKKFKILLMDCVEILKSLAHDNISSSNDIALKMMDCALELFGVYDFDDLIKDIMLNQPSMAVVLNIADSILSAGNKVELEKLKTEFFEAEDRVCNVALTRLSKLKNIATISYSKTVKKVIEMVEPEMVYVSVSHPAREGEVLAEELLKRDIEVTVFEDVAFSLVINRVDAFLIGADAIFDDFIVNKIGSFYLALLAKRYDLPFFVVANKFKVLKEELRDYYRILPMSAKEITSLNCNVINVYFEEVPMSLISEVITGE